MIIDSLVSLLRSNNAEVQHTSLKELMFSSTPSVVTAFLEEGNLKTLLSLCSSPHRKVESSALRLLWHLSAQGTLDFCLLLFSYFELYWLWIFFVAEMKVVLYEEGIMSNIKSIMEKDDPEDQLACSAILQNISEYRFCKGLTPRWRLILTYWCRRNESKSSEISKRWNIGLFSSSS